MTKLKVSAYTAACLIFGAALMTLVRPPRSEAQAVTPVRVMNGAARPVLSTFAPEEIYRTISSVALAEGAFVGAVEFDVVPPGKRLVIESVEVTVKASLGKPVHLVSIRTGDFFHAIAVQKQANTAQWDYYVGTHNVRWYANPGDPLNFSLSAPGENAAGSAIGNASVTGYFVPVP